MMDAPRATTAAEALFAADYNLAHDANASGVSWGAVIAGSFVAAALCLILFALGIGLGLSSISPWGNAGVSAGTVGKAAIMWLVVMEAISSALGGYIAGRLRVKWASVHADEVFFRDTAHGFLAWAVGLVVLTALMASATVSLSGHSVEASATAGAGAAVGASNANDSSDEPNGYWIDTLFRTGQPDDTSNGAATNAEVARILANGLKQQDVPAADRTYLSQLVSARTGLTQPEADARVSEVISQAQRAKYEVQLAADKARKAAATLALWTFIALLTGAFCASVAAAIGGRQRDYDYANA